MNIDQTISKAAESHATELNKSIKSGLEQISTALFIGLCIIALALRTKK